MRKVHVAVLGPVFTMSSPQPSGRKEGAHCGWAQVSDEHGLRTGLGQQAQLHKAATVTNKVDPVASEKRAIFHLFDVSLPMKPALQMEGSISNSPPSL